MNRSKHTWTAALLAFNIGLGVATWQATKRATAQQDLWYYAFTGTCIPRTKLEQRYSKNMIDNYIQLQNCQQSQHPDLFESQHTQTLWKITHALEERERLSLPVQYSLEQHQFRLRQHMNEYHGTTLLNPTPR